MASITAIILTKNEENNIVECIEAIRQLVDRIVVIDSFSEDKTIELAEKCGAEVYKHKFENYSRQFKYGVNIANVKTNWILRIDADERFTPELCYEIENIISKNEEKNISGIVVRYKIDFMGKFLKHGGAYPWKKLAIYKTGIGDIEERNMDEHIILSNGGTIETKNCGIHYSYRNLTYMINKQNWYSSREVLDYFDRNKKKDKLNFRTWLKMKVYYKLPFLFRAKLVYIYRYYFKFGFLDGREGKIFALMGVYFYRFLIDAKIYEQKKMNFELKDFIEFDNKK